MEMIKYRFLKVPVLFILINIIKKFHKILLRYVKWQLITLMQILLVTQLLIMESIQQLACPLILSLLSTFHNQKALGLHPLT